MTMTTLPVRFSYALLLLVAMATPACMSTQQSRRNPPPADPIASVAASELRSQGLDFARAGDLTRAQQYLAAAYAKGFDEQIVLPEIVKVCVAASRLRAALLYAEPYLDRHPGDAAMSYVVGSIHLALGNLQQASAHLEGALQPGVFVDAAYSLAVAESRQGQVQSAREHLQIYLAKSPRGLYASRAKRLLATLESQEVVQ